MPTPVAAARQCLSPAAVTALDAAVVSARRRAHSQTTSLHLISALLAPPAPPLLRDALAWAHSAAYAPRVQLRALELCFAVSLDRLPSASFSSSGADDPEPPVSSTLMAAVKRSQANQRRNSDTFHFYQQAASAQAPAAVKVELSQLVLAILDDPVVSRVFGDAGFRSGDIKLAILRPAPPMPMLGRLPTRSGPPPLFLEVPSPAAGSLGGAPGRRRTSAASATRGRNPMLVGMGAASAAADFAAASPYRVLPVSPSSIDQTELCVAAAMLSTTSGLIISIGDLKELVPDDGELQKMGRGAGRVWVMGWSATYETYLTFLSKFPLLDKDWELHLLPITAVRAGGSIPPATTAAAAFSKPARDGGKHEQELRLQICFSTSFPLLYQEQQSPKGRRMEGDLIHIKMHHGGTFSMEGPLTCDGGEVSIFRDCDSERTSYFRLVRMAKDAGFKDGDELYYTIPGCSLDEGIDLIHDDNSVVKMLNFAKKNNFAEIYLKHKDHENMSANPRSGLGTNEKLPAEKTKSKEGKLTSKKRDKRTWTAEEERLLIDILHNMNDSSWKVDTGHKSGYLTYIEKEMAKVLPHADLKADPHIRSKVKILKKQLSYVLEIMQNGSGFGWDDEKKMVTGDRETYMGWAKSREGAGPLYMKPMVNFDKLCEVYAIDLAKGGSAKGPGEEEIVEDGSTVDAQPTSKPAKENLPESNENTSPSGGSRHGRKRTYPDDDALESGLVSVSNTIAKFLEAEQENAKTMNGLQRAFMHESQVHEQTSANRTKLLDILQNLEGLTTEEVVMAIRVIGGDAGKTELFINLCDDYKVVFVR